MREVLLNVLMSVFIVVIFLEEHIFNEMISVKIVDYALQFRTNLYKQMGSAGLSMLHWF